MELLIHRDPLFRLLSRVASVVERKNTMPMLGNVLLRAEGDRLHAAATDLEISLRTSGDAQVETPGEIVVSARKLHEIVRELPEQMVRLKSAANQRVSLTCGPARFSLATVPPEEFPQLPDPEGDFRFSLEAAQASALIARGHFAMSLDEGRFNLNGLYLELEPLPEGGSLLRMVSTDSHRLALAEGRVEATADKTLGVILPRKGVLELRKLADEEDSPVEVAIGREHIQFLRPEVTLISKLVEGRFPNYRKVIPQANRYAADVETGAMVAAVRRMAVLSHEKTHAISLTFSGDALKIEAVNPEEENAEDGIAMTYDGPRVNMGISARYLQDFLGAVAGGTVRFALDSDEAPILATDPATPGFLCVMMPMRI